MQSALRDYELKEQARQEGRQEEREKAEVREQEIIANAEVEKLAVAKNFLSMGISIEDVSKATKLPVDVTTSLK